MRFIRSFQEYGTLLFVSHEMGAVQNLCKSAMWLGHGRVQKIGPSKEIAESYLHYTLQEVYGDKVKLETANSAVGQMEVENANDDVALDYESKFHVANNIGAATGWKTGAAEILSLTLTKMDGDLIGVFEGGERVCMKIHAKANEVIEKPILGFILRDRLGQDIFGENTLSFTAMKPLVLMAGQQFKAEFIFKLPMLPNGEYIVMASVADGDQYENVQHHYLHDAFVINVSSSRVRFGLVGVLFEQVTMKACDD
jgi:lipopolysaccharide transport system ATP-binding protein